MAVELLAVFGLVVNLGVLIGAIIIGIILYSIGKNRGVPEIQKAVSVIPMANESVQYSEVPMAVICVIAHQFQIPLTDVAHEYAKDSESRRALILKIFQKDPVTDYFLAHYHSKFIAHGYIGEELLIQ